MADPNTTLLDNRIAEHLKGGSPPEDRDGGNMGSGLTRLETHFIYIEKAMDEIRGDNKAVIADLSEMRVSLSKLPTTGNLWTMVSTVVGVALAIIAIFIGVLSLQQDRELGKRQAATADGLSRSTGRTATTDGLAPYILNMKSNIDSSV